MNEQNKPKPITILMADDDAEDCDMARAAIEKNHLLNHFVAVSDGEELLNYLYHRGAWSNEADSPRPGMILLDLNMPKMDGREALASIKEDPQLRQIPIVILTTSQAEEDIFASYDLGANSFITKPVTFEQLVDVMRGLSQYWLQIVALPRGAM
ncbi:MAG TPA: response regulator [Bryobacteraceae bacterium]|nr:response regulator [Bryobacteraceae bacterium]